MARVNMQQNLYLDLSLGSKVSFVASLLIDRLAISATGFLVFSTTSSAIFSGVSSSSEIKNVSNLKQHILLDRRPMIACYMPQLHSGLDVSSNIPTT